MSKRIISQETVSMDTMDQVRKWIDKKDMDAHSGEEVFSPAFIITTPQSKTNDTDKFIVTSLLFRNHLDRMAELQELMPEIQASQK